MTFDVGTVLDSALRPRPHVVRQPDSLRQPALPAGTGWSVEEIEAEDLPRLMSQIEALAERAIEANAYASATFLAAAQRHFTAGAAPRLLAVWRQPAAPQPRRLAGLFPLSRQTAWGAGKVLNGWSHPFTACGVPLVDRDEAVEVIRTALTALSTGRSRQNALSLRDVIWNGPFAAALKQAADSLGLPLDLLSQSRRAALIAPAMATEAPSPRRNKERRRLQRRLSEKGALAFSVIEEYNGFRAALETFLSLEARGWKGRNGTALVQAPAHANFTRAMLWSAARAGKAKIVLLELDGATIAAGILLTEGDHGFFWKIAYCESHAAFSPGALLALEMAEWIKTGALARVDSCAIPGHRMIESVWHERISVADVMIGLTPGRTPGYLATRAAEMLRRDLRARIKRIYNRLRG